MESHTGLKCHLVPTLNIFLNYESVQDKIAHGKFKPGQLRPKVGSKSKCLHILWYRCAQLVRIGNQLLGLETPLQWEMTFQLKSQQPDMPEV